MPTKHPRINVTKDAQLAAAVARARPIMGEAAEATIVRELAIRGAEALVHDEELRNAAMDDLVEWSAGGSIDRETLIAIDELAWRRHR